MVGIASLPLPHAQQVVIVALDSQGYLHMYATPLAGRVVVWDPSADVTAEGLHGVALGALPQAPQYRAEEVLEIHNQLLSQVGILCFALYALLP